jgi:hypothetical protein
MPTQKLTAEILAAALEGFQAQKRRIDAQMDEIRQLLDGSRNQPATAPEAPKRKRKLSAAGRRAIAEATKKRWAAFHAAKQAEKPALTKTAPKKARKKAAKKLRWAKKAANAPAAAIA